MDKQDDTPPIISPSSSANESVKPKAAEPPVKQEAPLDELKTRIELLMNSIADSTHIPSLNYRNVAYSYLESSKVKGAKEFFQALLNVEFFSEHATLILPVKEEARMWQNLVDAEKVLKNAATTLDHLSAEQLSLKRDSIQKEMRDQAQLEPKLSAPHLSDSTVDIMEDLKDALDKITRHDHLSDAHQQAVLPIQEIVASVGRVLAEKGAGQQLGGKSAPPHEMQPGAKWTNKA